MDRRSFLKILSAVSCATLPAELVAKAIPAASTKFLVLVELKGGNDGLNTLIPFDNPTYHKLRPSIAIDKGKILTIDKGVGMHPALDELMPLWSQGEIAWLQGVGYPNQIRSHFSSIDVWDKGDVVETDVDEGWVSKGLQTAGVKGVAINSRLGPLYSENLDTVGMINPRQFARQGRRIQSSSVESDNVALNHVMKVQQGVDHLSDVFWERLKHVKKPRVAFPKGRWGNDLLAAYNLMVSGMGIPVYKVSLGGFDTHVNQLTKHDRLMRQLSQGLGALRQNLKAAGLWDNTLIMTYSEFGRRLQENGNKGTDHGAAAPHFVLGGRVKGGLYGKYPSLNNLDERGDLIYTMDFRDVYASINHLWWGNPVQNRRIISFV